MNANQLGGIIRALIPGVVALATHYGLGTTDTDTIIVTAVATAAVSIWSAITNMPGTVIPTASLGMKK
jgi:hypothetical protein